MLFSERYGYTKINTDLLKESMPDSLRKQLWNMFNSLLFDISANDKHKTLKKFLFQYYVDRFFNEDIELTNYNKFKSLFNELEWFRVYDFIEFFFINIPDDFIEYLVLYDKEINPDSYPNKNDILIEINKIFNNARVPYRIINGLITPIIDEEEIKEIEKALNVDDKYKAVKEHLKKALALYSNREHPDYQNSIKESITALEGLNQILTGNSNDFSKTIDKLEIHPALKEGFTKLYGWTCDDKGIRHSSVKYEEPLSAGSSEARYMLITTSAFVNYLIEKLGINSEMENI